MTALGAGQAVHLVGIGGAGLSAIARILLARGCAVSGSDLNASAITRALAAEGARITIGHAAANIDGADIVLTTSAAPPEHIELAAAKARGIPVLRRREFLPLLLRGYKTVAVAGTHGKTTTTSMIVHILQCAGCDPSYIVGGVMGNTGRNAGQGAGAAFVIEADEYDNMFHGLCPQLAVVTNVELDHPDFFASAAAVQAAFETFISRLKPGGALIACADDPLANALALKRRESGGAVLTYGIEYATADWQATDLDFTGGATRCAVQRNGEPLGALTLPLPGAHNVLNALAALAAAAESGVPFAVSAAALGSFQATARRFEIRGERGGVIVVDDYAHHPTEIRVNLKAARRRYPRHQIIALWQPHTFSRVKQFWRDFLQAFDAADSALLLPIYAAREAPIAGISSNALARELAANCPALYCDSFEGAVEALRQTVTPPAVILIFSAGDANRIADMYLGAAP